MNPKFNSLNCLLTLTLLLAALVILLVAKPADRGSSSAVLTAQAGLVELYSLPTGQPSGDNNTRIWFFPDGGTPSPHADDNGQRRSEDKTCGRTLSWLEVRLQRCGHTWGG